MLLLLLNKSKVRTQKQQQDNTTHPVDYPVNCWERYRAAGTLIHCWWEFKTVQPYLTTVWKFLMKVNTVWKEMDSSERYAGGKKKNQFGDWLKTHVQWVYTYTWVCNLGLEGKQWIGMQAMRWPFRSKFCLSLGPAKNRGFPWMLLINLHRRITRGQTRRCLSEVKGKTCLVLRRRW